MILKLPNDLMITREMTYDSPIVKIVIEVDGKSLSEFSNFGLFLLNEKKKIKA